MNSNDAVFDCIIRKRKTTMDTKALRQKILDLAIHGKLVPQDPNDEPASVLLERIKAEKERLIKEGKIKRSKKSAKTADTPHYENVPFEVPESWVWCNITNVTYKITDGTHNSPINTPIGDYKYITAKNIKSTGISLNNITYVSKDIHNEIFARCNPEKGDILYIKDGATTGVVTINTLEEEFSLLSSVALIKPAKGILNKYLLYYLQSSLCYSAVRETMKGVGITRITLKQIENWNLPLPPFTEQSRIVTEIESWFALIDQIELGKANLQETIKQTKSKILDLAIHGKLVPQDPNDEPAIELLKRINPDFTPCDNGHSEKFPYEIPETWIWCGHNSILDISGGAQPAKSYFETQPKPNYIRLYQIRDYGESPIPVYIPINLASKQTEKGDILLARYGGSLGKVFHAEQGAYNVAMAKVIFKFENLIYKEFAYYYYLSDLYQGKLKEISRTAQAGFNSTDFNDMYFPLPPINEQQRIVQKIETLFSVLDNIQTTLEV